VDFLSELNPRLVTLLHVTLKSYLKDKTVSTGKGVPPPQREERAAPCGNFSDTSSLKFLKTKGSIGHAFAVCIHTENQNQVSFYPFALQEISVLFELTLGHLRYRLTDVPPQPNSPPDFVFRVAQARAEGTPALKSRSKSTRLDAP